METHFSGKCEAMRAELYHRLLFTRTADEDLIAPNRVKETDLGSRFSDFRG